jgi:FlgD Ig-like domain
MSATTRTTALIFLAGSLLLLPLAASAQITITSADILGLIGKSQIFESDSTTSITVNVGAAGANQVWDFRTLTLRARTFTYQFLAPQGTPFAANFPQANFVQKNTLPSQPGLAIYSYSKVNTTSLQQLGSATQTSDTTFVLASTATTPLPAQFGATWNDVRSDTSGLPPAFLQITRITSASTVDGSGQVRLPIGDFDCLRIRDNRKTVTKTVVNGAVILADSSTSISYNWVTKNNFVVAQASSQKNEANPNFTDASSFGRLSSTATAVTSRDDSKLPTGFGLAQNFPNPFNPETKIAFQLSAPERVELAIFTVTGEKVRTLIAAPLAAGTYTAVWDGKDPSGNKLASGIYLYRLQIGAAQQTKRMLLMR